MLGAESPLSPLSALDTFMPLDTWDERWKWEHYGAKNVGNHR